MCVYVCVSLFLCFCLSLSYLFILVTRETEEELTSVVEIEVGTRSTDIPLTIL